MLARCLVFYFFGAIAARSLVLSDESVRSHLVREENVHEADDALHLAFGKVNRFLEG